MQLKYITSIQRRTILNSIAQRIDLVVIHIVLGRSHQSHILKGKVKISVLEAMEELGQVESINHTIHKPFSLPWSVPGVCRKRLS